MIQTGKYFEDIVDMINTFRSEVQTFSSLGLLNINKHSEKFLKRLLNLTYGYELENLNQGKSNYPGLDLGDTGEGIAFQITATKKSDKIDDTLTTCIKYKHYKTFKNINIFILTVKQTSYTIKTATEPHFKFSPVKNIRDFNDLLKDIEHLEPIRMKAMRDYLQTELQPTIESIRNDKTEEKRQLLDTSTGLFKSGMTTFVQWRSKVSDRNNCIVVPDIYTKLNAFLSTPALKNLLLPILNPALRISYSNKEILYKQELINSGISNIFYEYAMLVEKSSLIVEMSNYSNQKLMLLNFYQEMVMLLTKILFFSKHSKSNLEIDVSVFLESNTIVYFNPTNSLVIDQVLNNFIMESPFELKETLIDVHTSTLADLLQKIMHGFVSHEPNFLNNEPFLTINRESTEFVINNMKKMLGISS